MCLLSLAPLDNIPLFFVDASYFVMGGFLGRDWSKVRHWVKTACGRQRFNVLGALNFITKKVEMITNDTYITSVQIVEILEKLAKTYTKPIIALLDNVPYNSQKESPQSNLVNITTLLKLNYANQTSNSVDLSWDSTLNVITYDVIVTGGYYAGTIFDSTKNTYYHLTGLTPNTHYNVKIRANQILGNMLYSDAIDFTTPYASASASSQALAPAAFAMSPGEGADVTSSVEIAPTGITPLPPAMTLEAGVAVQLTASVLPADAANKTITWSSGNAAVAAVDASGVVTGIAPGITTITAWTVNGCMATCTMTVTAPAPTPVLMEIPMVILPPTSAPEATPEPTAALTWTELSPASSPQVLPPLPAW